MKCLNCNNNIIITINIKNIFSLKKEYICDECYNKIKFEPNEIILPVNKYFIRIYYLLKEPQNIKYESLISEYSMFYNKIKEKTNYILTYNKYYMSECNYEFLEILANHHKTDITILVFELLD